MQKQNMFCGLWHLQTLWFQKRKSTQVKSIVFFSGWTFRVSLINIHFFFCCQMLYVWFRYIQWIHSQLWLRRFVLGCCLFQHPRRWRTMKAFVRSYPNKDTTARLFPLFFLKIICASPKGGNTHLLAYRIVG
jgi:hypothetical protein